MYGSGDVAQSCNELRLGMEQALSDRRPDPAECGTPLGLIPPRKASTQRVVLEEGDIGNQMKQSALTLPVCQWDKLCRTKRPCSESAAKLPVLLIIHHVCAMQD